MFEELVKGMEAVRAREIELHRSYGMSRGTVGDVLWDAAKNNQTANPAYVKDCMTTLNDFLSKRISRDDFDQKCKLLKSAARQTERKPITVTNDHRPYRDD